MDNARDPDVYKLIISTAGCFKLEVLIFDSPYNTFRVELCFKSQHGHFANVLFKKSFHSD